MGGVCTKHEEEGFVRKNEPKLHEKISDFNEEDVIVFRLNYLKNVLNEQRTEYARQRSIELQRAKEHKADKSRAKFFLKKMRVCEEMTKKLDDRILLVEKQLQNIINMKQDIAFSSILAKSNELLRTLSKEVDSKSLQEAMEVMNNYDESSNEITDLLNRFGNVTNDNEILKDYERLDSNFESNVNNLLKSSDGLKQSDKSDNGHFTEDKKLMLNL